MEIYVRIHQVKILGKSFGVIVSINWVDKKGDKMIKFQYTICIIQQHFHNLWLRKSKEKWRNVWNKFLGFIFLQEELAYLRWAGKFRKDLQSFSISRHTDDNLAALVSYAGITIKTQRSHAYYHLTRLNFTDEIIHIFT